jgi:hypothetical protein
LDGIHGASKGNIPNIHPYGLNNLEVNRRNEQQLRPGQHLRKRAPHIDEPTSGWPKEVLPDDLGLLGWIRSVHKAVCGIKRGQMVTPGGFQQREVRVGGPKRYRSSDEVPSEVSSGGARRSNNSRTSEVVSTSGRSGPQQITWMPSAVHFQSLLNKVR